MRSDEFINEIVKKIEDYRNVISNIGFSLPEAKQLTKKPKTLEEILHAIDVIIDSSKELNLIFENSPDSIFVADSEGVSLRINKAFESIAGMPRDQILGRNVTDVEREGIFRPSVCRLALNEKGASQFFNKSITAVISLSPAHLYSMKRENCTGSLPMLL